jgi:hypothetical protein
MLRPLISKRYGSAGPVAVRTATLVPDAMGSDAKGSAANRDQSVAT